VPSGSACQLPLASYSTRCFTLFHCPHSALLPLQDVAVSSGSACTSASLEPSYVLRALGVEEDMVRSCQSLGAC